MSVYFETYSLFDVIGVAGFFFYLTAYLSLTMKWLEGHSVPYFTLNLCAASCMLVSLSTSFNLASVLIQVFWVCISICGLAMIWHRTMKLRRTARTDQTERPGAADFSRRLSSGWQLNPNLQSRLQGGQRDGTVVALGDFAHDGQAKPAAARI